MSFYTDIGELALDVVSDKSIGDVTAWTIVRTSGDGVGDDITLASEGVETLYVIRAALSKFVTAAPGVPVWDSDFLIFGATSVDLVADDIITDGISAYVVSGAPITDLGFLLAPADATAVPTLETGTMAAGEYNGWTIEEGAVFASTVKWPGISDATDYEARMDVRLARDATSAAIVQLTSNPAAGLTLSSAGGFLVIAITIDAPDTVSLDFPSSGIAYYDIEVIPPTGEDDAFKALYGQIRYRREVTAAPITP